jgi:hypothetical protein
VPVQLALRLKVQNRQIVEAEHVFARIDAPAQVAALQTPRPAFFATVPQADRMPKAWMLLLANAYYDSLVLGDGELSPFAEDCGRRENACTPPASVVQLQSAQRAALVPAVLQAEGPRCRRTAPVSSRPGP